jgi:hypothetical protein
MKNRRLVNTLVGTLPHLLKNTPAKNTAAAVF